jgi:hypothetical protein
MCKLSNGIKKIIPVVDLSNKDILILQFLMKAKSD